MKYDRRITWNGGVGGVYCIVGPEGARTIKSTVEHLFFFVEDMEEIIYPAEIVS